MSTSRHLSLELDAWATRPVGRITDEAGQTVAFDGWLSLATALEGICTPSAPEPVPAPRS